MRRAKQVNGITGLDTRYDTGNGRLKTDRNPKSLLLALELDNKLIMIDTSAAASSIFGYKTNNACNGLLLI